MDMKKTSKTIKSMSDDAYSDDDSEGGGGLFGNGNDKKKPKKDNKSKTPVLDSFGRDLTRLAEEGKLDPVIGRKKEIERVCQILARRKKNNPILIGEPGCVDGDTIITVKKVSDSKGHDIINK